MVTRWRDDWRLHLNGHLQFSSADEYRYHETLMLPALSAALEHRPDGPLRILILGGGDGLAAREALSFAQVAAVDLVDIDRRVVELFRDRPELSALNRGSLRDPRLSAHFEDAFAYVRREGLPRYDVVVLDLPDPSSAETNKLFTRAFFGMALRLVSARGVLVAQATSPFYAREAYWCAVHTLGEAARGVWGKRFSLVPYHAHVPSFGDWGFVLTAPRPLSPRSLGPVREGRFLTPEVLRQALVFPPDSSEVRTEINELDRPVLVGYHTRG